MLKRKIFLASSFILFGSLLLTEDISEIDKQLMQLQQEEYHIQELIQQQNTSAKKALNQEIIPSLSDPGSLPDNTFSTSLTSADGPVSAQQGKQKQKEAKNRKNDK